MKLIAVFGVVAFLVVCAVAAIIVAFALVTSDSVTKAVLFAIQGDLETVKREIDRIAARTDAPLSIVKRMLEVTGRDALSLPNTTLANLTDPQTQFNDWTASMQQMVVALQSDSAFSYVYVTAKSPHADDHWVDFGSGYTDKAADGAPVQRYPYIEVPDMTLQSAVLSGATLTPIDLIATDAYDYTVTGEIWQREIALQRVDTPRKNWFSATAFQNPVTNKTTSLITYSIAMTYDADGNCIQAMNLDMAIDSIAADLIKAAAPKSSILYLIDARNLSLTAGYVNGLIASSLPEKTLPFYNSTTGVPYDFTATPCKPCNAVMRLVRDAYGGDHAVIEAKIEIIIDDKSLDDIIAASVVNATGGLHMLVVSQTPRSFYFGDAERTMAGAIGGGVAAVVLCIAAFVGVWFAVLNPVAQTAEAMRKIAALEQVKDDDEPPFLDELKPVAEELQRLNSAIQSFSRYVPKGVVVALLAAGRVAEIGVTPREAVCVFSDIANFTTMTERLSVNERVFGELMNKYFNTMTDIVMSHNGIIIKFIGDAIMAAWGALGDLPNYDTLAVLAMLRMQHACLVDPLFSAFDELGEALSVRVGAAKGEFLCGTMGSSQRCGFDLMGDMVNLSSRLEGFNKVTGTGVAINEALAIAALKSNVACRLLCRVKVKGKDMAVSVYEPLGILSTMPTDARDGLENSSNELDAQDLGGTAIIGNSDSARQGSGKGSGKSSSGEVPKRRTSITIEVAAHKPKHSPSSRRHGGGGDDDMHSVASTAMFGSRKTIRDTFEMRLREARKLVPVTDGRRTYAKRFTHCAKLFINGDFQSTIAALELLSADVVAAVTGVKVENDGSGGFSSGTFHTLNSPVGAAAAAGGSGGSSAGGGPMSPVTSALRDAGFSHDSACASSGGNLLGNSPSFTCGDIPVCPYTSSLARDSGPYDNDRTFALLFDLSKKYAANPPDEWFGAIVAEEK